jgi:hypothetical protein
VELYENMQAVGLERARPAGMADEAMRLINKYAFSGCSSPHRMQ